MKYIVAVSGGVDSVALLHMLQQHSDHELVVAHVSHGIRPDSFDDLEFVWKLADAGNVPFEHVQLQLGSGASEEQARDARYTWLDGIKQKHGADAIVTAHHQDDVLETMVLNLQRGTGWRGLASLRSTGDRHRPLLGVSKARLVRYALDHGLVWREDSTNNDVRYTRNYIRHGVLPKLTPEQRRKLVRLAKQQYETREKIEQEVARVTGAMKSERGVRRHALIMTPDSVALEVLRHVTHGAHEPRQLRRLLHFVKTGRQGAVLQLGKGKNALLTRHDLIV